MKASEFRVGNYILDCEAEPEVTVYWQVEEIKKYSDASGVGVVFRDGSCWSHEPEPIPLTEEWLLKFGFTWRNGALRLGGFSVHLHKNIMFYYSQGGFNNLSVKLEYVHQLQNLYFALTGVELKIK